MNTSQDVIRLIKRLREEKKMTIEDLAKKVGKAKSTLSRYESEQREFPINDVGLFAEALGTSVEFLLGIKSQPTSLKQNFVAESEYYYFPTSVSAGLPLCIDSLTEEDCEVITLPDLMMGKWAGSDDIFITRVNGESMNKIIPDCSLIAVKPVELSELKNNDIVVFSDGGDYSVKRFFHDKDHERVIFRPDSYDDRFFDYIVSYERAQSLKIHGKVVLYIVELD